jgi:iron(III) transport system permease protein
VKSLLKSLNNIWSFVILFAFLIVGLLLILPLYNIFVSSFIDNKTGSFTLQNYIDILGRGYYRKAIYNSIFVGFSSMFGALLIGVPLAFFTTRFKIRGKSVISTQAI